MGDSITAARTGETGSERILFSAFESLGASRCTPPEKGAGRAARLEDALVPPSPNCAVLLRCRDDAEERHITLAALVLKWGKCTKEAPSKPMSGAHNQASVREGDISGLFCCVVNALIKAQVLLDAQSTPRSSQLIHFQFLIFAF